MAVTHLQSAMTKHDVLHIFSQNSHPVTPDEIWRQIGKNHKRSSVYSYLFRLHRQGLLNRARIDGRLVYTISDRGIERLNYFDSQKDKQ
jgi:DNA-binding PadR family transcriptional regulator